MFTSKLKELLLKADHSWRGTRLSKVALGKYIILMASLLHIGWAFLLLLNPSSARATPLYVINMVAGGPVRAAVILALTAIVAMVFPFMRNRVTNTSLAFMLVPQQTLMLMSAGAGVFAASQGAYLDGTVIKGVHILADQLPAILSAVLYTAAVLEAAFEPPNLVLPGTSVLEHNGEGE